MKQEWVEIKDLFGTEKIPIRAAFVINEALGKAMADGDISFHNRWQLIEYLAADYLAGGT